MDTNINCSHARSSMHTYCSHGSQWYI